MGDETKESTNRDDLPSKVLELLGLSAHATVESIAVKTVCFEVVLRLKEDE